MPHCSFLSRCYLPLVGFVSSFEELEASGSFSSLGDRNSSATAAPTSAAAGDTAKLGSGTTSIVDNHSKLNLRQDGASGSTDDLDDVAPTESDTGPDSDADIDSSSVVTPEKTPQGVYGEQYAEDKEEKERSGEGSNTDGTAAAAAGSSAPTAQLVAALIADSAWATEEDEWIGRLAAADRSQSKSSMRFCLERSGSLSMSRLSCSRAGSLVATGRSDSLARGITAGAPGLVTTEDREVRPRENRASGGGGRSLFDLPSEACCLCREEEG